MPEADGVAPGAASPTRQKETTRVTGGHFEPWGFSLRPEFTDFYQDDLAAFMRLGAHETMRRYVRGSQLYVGDTMDRAKVERMFAAPTTFARMCEITTEDSDVCFLEPTLYQHLAIWAAHLFRWLMVDKHRQAKMTSGLVLAIMLRDCMYLKGLQGRIIADTIDTAEEAFERLQNAYNQIQLRDPSMVTPLVGMKQATGRRMKFAHGGSIKIITAGSRAPAIGRSPDRLHITEWGEAAWQERAAVNIFPSVAKRRKARIILESTPGKMLSHFQGMWLRSLEGKGWFHPLFLRWWLDDTCREDPCGIEPTEEELAFMARHPGMDSWNLAFRRSIIGSGIGDERAFSSKFPSDPLDGWLGAQHPILPLAMLQGAYDVLRHDDPTETETAGCCLLRGDDGHRGPRPGRKYLVVADPAGLGDSGDPSALLVFDGETREEIAFWEGQEMAHLFASRLERVQAFFGGWEHCMLAIESNAAAVLAILRDRGTRGLYWTARGKPGWFATDARLRNAEGHFVEMLRMGDIIMRSRGTLHQLINYDGSRKKRMRGEDGGTHHFDRARCAVIAADIFRKRAFVTSLEEVAEAPHVPGHVPVSALTGDKAKMRREMSSPFALPPQHR